MKKEMVRAVLIAGASLCCGLGLMLACLVIIVEPKLHVHDIPEIAIALFTSIPLLLLIPSHPPAKLRPRLFFIALMEIVIILLFVRMLLPPRIL